MAIDLRRGLEVRFRRAVSILGAQYHKARLRGLAHLEAGRRLRNALGREVALVVEFDSEIPFAHDVVIERRGPGLRVRLSPHNIAGEERLIDRVATYGFWLLACGPGVRAISVSDTAAPAKLPTTGIKSSTASRPIRPRIGTVTALSMIFASRSI